MYCEKSNICTRRYNIYSPYKLTSACHLIYDVKVLRFKYFNPKMMLLYNHLFRYHKNFRYKSQLIKKIYSSKNCCAVRTFNSPDSLLFIKLIICYPFFLHIQFCFNDCNRYVTCIFCRVVQGCNPSVESPDDN